MMLAMCAGQNPKAAKREWNCFPAAASPSAHTHINNLDDGCLMHIFSFLSPIPDRYNSALVCHRWLFLACHPRLWLRVDRSVKEFSEPGAFPSVEAAVSAARPGDTILIAAGGTHLASNIQIKKPLCLIGGGELPDDTALICSRGSDSALELLAACKVANLTVKAELGCCLLHRSGRLIIDGCILQCETNPLDYLSHAIISTASGPDMFSTSVKGCADGVSVSRTRIEGGAKAILTSGTLALEGVRVIYSRTSIFFWFDVEHRKRCLRVKLSALKLPCGGGGGNLHASDVIDVDLVEGKDKLASAGGEAEDAGVVGEERQRTGWPTPTVSFVEGGEGVVGGIAGGYGELVVVVDLGNLWWWPAFVGGYSAGIGRFAVDDDMYN
ncbi:hypothetical protein RJ639_039537 [Escallonia herrerae]|uniref:F-box domain-containing protein n=1 Tax=Escallonia herrerae TaxID=1293975 RepID=A0AA88WMB5_9ASTE|nr:hypothetical protein RJ639_039537 [Escallonia herrerae]